ncbi:unnamed protein product [Phytophthora lilii]|uniref:Unnamed protein product n=1 Tax=Phytophthora lilii TaxID=2077276 RepID=A0A9W6U396_9STRA|nr:unnamed protein product [Phytophthora lilii]
MAISEDELSSDEDVEHGLMGNAAMLRLQTSDAASPSEANLATNSVNGTAPMRLPSRHAERGPSDDTHSLSDHALSSREHEYVVNPDELVESDESDEEAAAGHDNILPTFEDGHDTARS